jgi:hypothetical protein
MRKDVRSEERETEVIKDDEKVAREKGRWREGKKQRKNGGK